MDSVPRPPGYSMHDYIWWRAVTAVAVGDQERAMELLRENGYRPYLHTQYQLEPLWDYPPFQEFIRPKG